MAWKIPHCMSIRTATGCSMTIRTAAAWSIGDCTAKIRAFAFSMSDWLMASLFAFVLCFPAFRISSARVTILLFAMI